MAPVKRSGASYKNHHYNRRGISTAISHPESESILICTAAMCCSASPSQALTRQHVPKLLTNLQLLRKASSLWTCYLELHRYIKDLIYPVIPSSCINPPLTQGENNRGKQLHCGWRMVPPSCSPHGSWRADRTDWPQPIHHSVRQTCCGSERGKARCRNECL